MKRSKTMINIQIVFLFLVFSGAASHLHAQIKSCGMADSTMKMAGHEMKKCADAGAKSCCDSTKAKDKSATKQHSKKTAVKGSTMSQDMNMSGEDKPEAIKANDPRLKSLGVFNKVCPVLGEEVESDQPAVIYKGKIYAFCCAGCDKKFTANPEKYLKNLSADGKTFHKN
jgi:YHS domain-containing protein